MRIILFLFISYIYISCTNPFSVREAEKPQSNSSIFFETPTTSNIVIQNFRFAIIEKNVSNYKQCFVDSATTEGFRFKFIPDQRIESSLFNNWTMADEESYLTNVIYQSQTIDLAAFDEIDFLPLQGSPDSVETSIFDYSLFIETESESQQYRGQAKMKLVKNANSLWAIYSWEDFPADDGYEFTWSLLKSQYRNN